MPFIEYGKTIKFPRSQNVEIHVREVILLPDSDNPREYVDIREFLRAGEVYGHGVMVPRHSAKDLSIALQRLADQPLVVQ